MNKFPHTGAPKSACRTYVASKTFQPTKNNFFSFLHKEPFINTSWEPIMIRKSRYDIHRSLVYYAIGRPTRVSITFNSYIVVPP